MQLSIGMVQDALKRQFSLSVLCPSHRHVMELQGAAMYTSASPDPHTLYVAEARRLPVRWKFRGRISLVVVGTVAPDYFAGQDVSYLCVEDNRFPLVFNAVLEIFRKYEAFDQALKQAIIQDAGQEAVCDVISEFLQKPLIVFDAALRLQYMSDDAAGLLEWETDAYSGLKLLPTEFINQLNLVYTETAENFINGAVLLRDDRLPYNLICTLNGKNNYIILVFETEQQPLTRSTLELVSYLNEYILIAFEGAAQKGPSTSCLSSLILSMLGGTKYSATDLANQLSSVDWHPDDSCCCIVMYALEERETSKYIKPFCLKLENQFSACVAFPYQERAVAIVNLDKSGCDVYDIPHRIGILLRDGLLKAGVSFKYWSFDTTPYYFQQACSAYEMGKLYNPSSWCYIFEDYALYYFTHYGSSRLPPRHLCHPGLVQLHRYDQQNGTDLLRTLEAYVGNNCNAVTAANALFIHRNTFYQRLSRIQELLKLDLEDPDVRLYLQLSTHLIRMYYYELEHGFHFPRE